MPAQLTSLLARMYTIWCGTKGLKPESSCEQLPRRHWRTVMSGRKAFVALAVATALGLFGAAPAFATDRDDHGTERGGTVVRCSLDGVNPVHHPEVFGNAATARSYGFYQTPDRVWRVLPDCRR
jgi:hypothetical protein